MNDVLRLLDSQLQTVLDAAGQVAGSLVGIHDAEAAIDAGVITEWRVFGAADGDDSTILAAQLDGLRSLIAQQVQ